MTIKLTAICLLVGSLLAPLMLHADEGTDQDRKHPINFVKDSAITTAVKTKLAAKHLASLKHIKVDTDSDGVVWLSGTVRTQHAADKAGEIARNTDGVRAVKNNIAITPAH
jgi:hyperosmotically inducible protein